MLSKVVYNSVQVFESLYSFSEKRVLSWFVLEKSLFIDQRHRMSKTFLIAFTVLPTYLPQHRKIFKTNLAFPVNPFKKHLKAKPTPIVFSHILPKRIELDIPTRASGDQKRKNPTPGYRTTGPLRDAARLRIRYTYPQEAEKANSSRGILIPPKTDCRSSRGYIIEPTLVYI